MQTSNVSQQIYFAWLRYMGIAVIRNPIQFQLEARRHRNFHHLLVSMDEKRRIKFEGETVEATAMAPPVLTEELWNRYLLADGTIIRTKIVATSIDRIEGKYDNEGQPIYNIESKLVVWTTCPEHLKKKGGDEDHGE